MLWLKFYDNPISHIPSSEPTYYRDIYYKHGGQNDNRSVFIVPRRVYFDNRVYKGKARNVVLILAQVHDDAVEKIVACELNGFYTKSISIIQEDTYWVRLRRPGYTHCAIVVECKGLPSESIVNGTFPKLVYKKDEEKYYSLVVSELPLILKSFKSTPAKGKGSIVVCTTMFGHPAKFDHWLKYQKTVGVDGVHLNTDRSFIDSATMVYPFLNESLNNGFVQVDVWNDIIDGRAFYHGQVAKYQDCILRHINVFEYVLIYDADDYFNPRIPDQKDIHYYFDQYFSESSTATVLLPWRQMTCSPVSKKLETLQDGNLTSILSGYDYSYRADAKCAHRVSGLMFVAVHSQLRFLPGYWRVRGNADQAYVAHNRNTNKECIG